MSLEKTAKFAGDFRTIYLAVAIMITGAAWGGDLRWLQIADSGQIATDVELRILKQRKAEMVIQKSYEPDPQKIKLFEALIINIQSEMDALRENPQ